MDSPPRECLNIRPRSQSARAYTMRHDAGILKAKKASFTKFPLLPVEIRLKIWEHALPDPRHVAGVFIVIINFELARPRAIIPPFEWCDEVYNDIASEGTRDITHVYDVTNLLHASPESRDVALRTFRLDCDSVVAEENTPWWNEEDTLYFPGDWDEESQLKDLLYWWISQKRNSPFHHFANVRHIAMHCPNNITATQGGETSLDNYLLQNFPALSSISLLFDPMEFRHLTQGSIKLYEPYDVVVEQFNRTPSELKSIVTARLEAMARPKLEVPVVECFVMCWKKPKGQKSG